MLRESEERYRLLVELSPDSVVLHSKGKIVFVNPATLKLLGVTSSDEVVGKPVLDFVHPDYRRVVIERFQQLAQGKTVPPLEEKFFRIDGSTIDVETTAAPIHYQNESVSLVMFRDITERKRAEKEIQMLAFALKSISECVSITDMSDILLFVNNAFLKKYGYSGHELLGKNINIVRSPNNPPEAIRSILATTLHGGWNGELLNRKKDGTDFPISLSTSVIRDENGQAIALVGVANDITERKRTEEALRQMQKLEGLGTLAGGIAHDFNNILGIILAYVTSIKQFKDDTTKLDLAIDTVTKAVDRGKTLVQQILTFARKTETEIVPVNVNDVVKEIMVMIFETFPKTLTYLQNIDKGVSYINADRSQLHQALLNLCVNARDAMPKAGVLTINTRMVSGISLHHQHPDATASSYVCIEVSDTGKGMTPEIKRRIYEPFFTTKEQGKGTGLGLSVVFGVIQSHKGFIDVDSELGKGTTFRLYLPTSQVAEPIIEKEKETLESIPGGTETLLVVEDEEMLLMSLRMVLVEKGYKVLSAGDGLKALEIYQERKDEIALVLTDLGLPNISGLEISQRIKAINPHARMILVTGFLDPETKAEFMNAGIQHFLYKPYDLTKVLKEVREVLDEK